MSVPPVLTCAYDAHITVYTHSSAVVASRRHHLREVHMRRLIRWVAMVFGAVAPAAVVAVYSAAEAAATTCQHCSSDARLKTNIRPI